MTTKDTKKRRNYFNLSYFEKGASLLSAENKPFIAEIITKMVISISLTTLEFSGFSPFALAFSAMSGIGCDGIITLIFTVCGYFLFGSAAMSMRYIMDACLIFMIFFITRRARISEKYWFRPLTALLVSMATGFVFVDGVDTLALFLIESICILVSCFAFRYALSPLPAISDTAHCISILYLVSLVCAGLMSVEIFGVLSVGRFMGVLLLIAASFRAGTQHCCMFAVILGTILDIFSGHGMFFAFTYGFSALISSTFGRRGSFFFAVTYVLSNAAASFLQTDSYYFIPSLYEAFSASIIFMLLPSGIMTQLCEIFPDASSRGSFVSANYIREKVNLTAEAFQKLYDSARGIVTSRDNTENIATVFDKAADISCRGCPNMPNCWHLKYEDTLNVLNNMTAGMLENGRINKSDFPKYFADSCINLDLFTSAINSELRALIYKREFKYKFRENLKASFAHYGDMYLVLKNVSDELKGEGKIDYAMETNLRKYMRSVDYDVNVTAFRDGGNRLHIELSGHDISRFMRGGNYLDELSLLIGIRLCTSGRLQNERLVLLEAEPYCVNIGMASRAKSGEKVSGDGGRFFKTDSGVMYIILSDGMGTGSSAEQMSRETLSVLESFLRADIPPKTAIKIMSDAMMLKNETGIYSATIDMMGIDLFTGNGRIYKSGASKTYIKTPNRLISVSQNDFGSPFGFDGDYMPKSHKITLREGNGAVIISDGILGDGDDMWLRDMLSDCDFSSPKDLSRKILRRAAEVNGMSDDMTVICLGMEKRK